MQTSAIFHNVRFMSAEPLRTFGIRVPRAKCKNGIMQIAKYSMIIYFFLNDECAIVNSIARLSLLDMNWIVCTELTIISEISEISFRDILIFLTTKRGETSVFCRKTNSSVLLCKPPKGQTRHRLTFLQVPILEQKSV